MSLHPKPIRSTTLLDEKANAPAPVPRFKPSSHAQATKTLKGLGMFDEH
ncbi:MAG: hypothetical protein R3194_00625 [Limnobacter sp.]|nr:hypothetical protein [Limnobacter sp.]